MAYKGRKAQKITPTMEKALNYMVAHPNCTIMEVSKATEVHYQTAYAWFKSPIFIERYQNLVNEQWSKAISDAQLHLINKIKAEDWNAIKYILDSAGYNAPQKVELSTNTIKITVNDNDEEDV